MATSATDLLHVLAQATSGLFGAAFLRRLLLGLCTELGVTAAFVAEVEGGERERVHVYAYEAVRGTEWDAIEQIPGPPLTEILDEDAAANAARLRERYPGDPFFDELGIESAYAVPLLAADGAYIGHLGVMDAGTAGPSSAERDVLRILASRAAVELERRRAESALERAADEQASLRRIATLVAQGTAPETLLEAVTFEVGRLFDADAANIARFEEGGIRIMGAWSEGETATPPTDELLPLDGDTVSAKVLRTGRPARLDSYEGVDGALADRIRGLGIRAAIAAPVTVEARLWGSVTAWRRGEEPFPPGAEARLGAFAELFGLAVVNAEAHEQLAASRARLAEAGVAERRRLERNLHDGAQQRLVMLALTLRMLESRVEGEAAAMLHEASAELATALEELREIARGIHPAVLTDRGLIAAIRALVARAPLPVDLEAGVHVRLTPAVEACGYYVVAEALTNVAKYAQASAATVRASENEGMLWVEVEDDGVGGAEAAPGSGLSGLADRVEALGGILRVRSTPGEGTLVRAEIPSRRP